MPLVLVAIAAGVAFYIGPLRTEIRFVDDAGHVPETFEITLRRGGSEQKSTIENGRINLLRGRWDKLEITDLSYIRATYPVRKGVIVIERNTLLKLRQASTGGPSIPQRGDPDPRDE